MTRLYNIIFRGKDFERGWHKVHMKQNFDSEIYLPTDQDAQVDLNVVSIYAALNIKTTWRH